jgi:16S rRNA (cytosine967-C5)-methyltransferase
MDVYEKKIPQIMKNAERLSVNIVEGRAWDAVQTDPTLVGEADRVLVDAPCSGLGTVKKKPEIKYKGWDAQMEALPRKQLDILNASSRYTKLGGTLVYSTCTILKRENQKVTGEFLRNNEEFEMVDEQVFLPHLADTDGFYICKMKRIEKKLQ